MTRRSIPVDELKNIASANTGNVEIAQALIQYVQKHQGGATVELVDKIRTLTKNVKQIDDALNKVS